jgi:hypothetical protein
LFNDTLLTVKLQKFNTNSTFQYYVVKTCKKLDLNGKIKLVTCNWKLGWGSRITVIRIGIVVYSRRVSLIGIDVLEL